MASADRPKFRRHQLVMVTHDGTGPVMQPDFIVGVDGWTKKHGWSYHVAGVSHPLAEGQIRRVKKKEIR